MQPLVNFQIPTIFLFVYAGFLYDSHILFLFSPISYIGSEDLLSTFGTEIINNYTLYSHESCI